MKQKVINNKPLSLLNLFGLKYKSNTRCLVVVILSLLMVICGGMIMHYQPLELFVQSQIKLSPNSLLFYFFQHPPIDVIISVYVFNITNPAAFLAGKEKLKLKEVGPYVYQEDLHNTNPKFNDNGTLTFTSKRFVRFRRDLSVGDDKIDRIISSNIPLLGMSSFMKNKSFISNVVLAQLANIINSKSMLELTIDEYLWGYDDKLVTLANNALPNWINFRRFGILDRMMALDNASNTVTIKINEDPIQSVVLNEQEKRTPYTVMNFNGSPGLQHWGYDDKSQNVSSEHNNRCNSIQGSYESGVFDTNYLNENTTVWLYRRAFCRAMPLQYDGHGQFQNIDTVKYKIRPDFLDLPANNPLNECYCNQPGINCRYKGVGYLSPCYYGIPITISQPHFLGADPRLLEQVEGMHPDANKHETYVAIAERLGLPVDAFLRVQINMDIDTRLSARCEPFNGIMLPLFWLQMSEYKLSWVIYTGEFVVKYVVPVVSGLASWLMIIFGVAIAATAALLTFYSQPHHAFEDPFDNKIGYTPIRVIPVGIYTPQSIRISK